MLLAGRASAMSRRQLQNSALVFREGGRDALNDEALDGLVSLGDELMREGATYTARVGAKVGPSVRFAVRPRARPAPAE